MMKRKSVCCIVGVIPVVMFLFGTTVNAAPAKDKIRVGWVTSLSA